jgi:hypothetical protein
MVSRAEAQVEVTYEGEAVRDGTMDVRQLAPALLSIGAMCEAANRVLNEDRASIAVHVKTFRPGSANIVLDVIQQNTTIVQTLVFPDSALQSGRDILDWIGLGSGITGVTLIALIRWLRGKKPDSATILQDGNVKLEIRGDVRGSTIIVAPQVKALYDDRQVRDGLAGAVEPLKHPGIDAFFAKQGGRVVEGIEKSQAEYFEVSESAGPETLVYEDEQRAAYEIVKPVLTGDLTWVLSDGDSRFDVRMDDETFLEKVRRREYVFGAGDVLIARVAVKTMRRQDGKLKTERRIVRVLEVKYATHQTGLWDHRES